jgi:hypothetical protein
MRIILQEKDRKTRRLIAGCCALVVIGIALPVNSELKPFEAARRLREYGLVQVARVDRLSFVVSAAGREALVLRAPAVPSPAFPSIARDGLPRLQLAAVPPVVVDDTGLHRAGLDAMAGGPEGSLLLPSLSLQDEAPRFGLGTRVAPSIPAVVAPPPLTLKDPHEVPLPSPGGPVGWFPLVVMMVRHLASEPAFAGALTAASGRLLAAKGPAAKADKTAKKPVVEAEVETEDEPAPRPKRAAVVSGKPAPVPASKPAAAFAPGGSPSWAKFDNIN